jgi:putative flippase GtrA
MLTDLNLTDMETCYKVFRRDVIQAIDIKENRFGVEAEIVAKVAHMRLRIFEMGISYRGRTYEEGKKIGVKDGVRAIYCILRYNAHRAPMPIQFILYVLIGGIAALFNLFVFLGMLAADWTVTVAAPTAFILAAVVNYLLCILLLFRHKARWNSVNEMIIFFVVVALVGVLDLEITKFFMLLGTHAWISKLFASIIGLIFNFLGRRFLVFPEPPRGPWKPQGGISG